MKYLRVFFLIIFSNARQLCLICGRVSKQIGSSAFYSVETLMLTSGEASNTSPLNGLSAVSTGGHGPSVTIASRLREILRVDFLRKRYVPSEEICKKCFRQLNEIDYLESQV